MVIRPYRSAQDEEKIMQLIEGEGEEWSCYTKADANDRYRLSLKRSITFVAYDGKTPCGFVRCLEDYGFYIYVCDLLVKPSHRGMGIGRSLMEAVYGDFPEHTAYVMSDVDPYYEKLGYQREGSVFEVTRPALRGDNGGTDHGEEENRQRIEE